MKKIVLFLMFCILGFICFSQPKLRKKYHFGDSTYPGARSNEVYLLSVSVKGDSVYTDGNRYAFMDTIKYFQGDTLKHQIRENYELITWMTKRLGTTSFDTAGFVLKNYKPVFVKKLEFTLNTTPK